jgi:hypothetical protein
MNLLIVQKLPDRQPISDSRTCNLSEPPMGQAGLFANELGHLLDLRARIILVARA